jgi:ATP-dependent helicase HrpA
VLTEAMTVAAFLALQDPRERPAEHAQAADQAHREFRVEGSDFLGMLKLWDDWHRTREELGSSALKRWCRDHFLSFLRMREWQELRAQLATLARGLGLHRNELPADPEHLHKALLAGLVSHVGRKTERGDYLGTRNRRFQIHPGSGQAKRRPEWIMSAEIAETTRVYAREVAGIKPEWILEVAPHLLNHDIHEPHFQARDGRVGAWDRITLYGLVVAPRAPVNFARHDPQEARRLFIQHGLVEGRLRSRSSGLAANLATVAEIAELEARGRRRDLFAEEDRLRAFYDERLPEHVVDGPGFEAWCRKAEKADPDILRIDRAALLQEPEAVLPEGAYPDALAVQGIRLPLSYRFEAGAGGRRRHRNRAHRRAERPARLARQLAGAGSARGTCRRPAAQPAQGTAPSLRARAGLRPRGPGTHARARRAAAAGAGMPLETITGTPCPLVRAGGRRASNRT